MISWISGTLKRRFSDRVVVVNQGIGYDVYLPQFVMRAVDDHVLGEPIELDIYYHVTERQIRPTLIGFNNEVERRFFEKFISVEDIGPLKAARAMTMSVSTIAQAIEAEDFGTLRQLPGIGDRTAKKMVATLRGKVTEEALLLDEGFDSSLKTSSAPVASSDLREDGIESLVVLGYRRFEATNKIDAALKRNPDVETFQDLLSEVYRGERLAKVEGTT